MFVFGQRAQGFAVAVVGLVLADDDQVDVLFEVGERGDVWFIGVFGVLERRMEDRTTTYKPWIDQDGECAGEPMRVVVSGISWREGKKKGAVRVEVLYRQGHVGMCISCAEGCSSIMFGRREWYAMISTDAMRTRMLAARDRNGLQSSSTLWLTVAGVSLFSLADTNEKLSVCVCPGPASKSGWMQRMSCCR